MLSERFPFFRVSPSRGKKRNFFVNGLRHRTKEGMGRLRKKQ